jgi:hypothetical protein
VGNTQDFPTTKKFLTEAKRTRIAMVFSKAFVARRVPEEISQHATTTIGATSSKLQCMRAVVYQRLPIQVEPASDSA